MFWIQTNSEIFLGLVYQRNIKEAVVFLNQSLSINTINSEMNHTDAFSQISSKLESISKEELTNLGHVQYEEMIYEKIGSLLYDIPDKNVLLMLVCLCFRLEWTDLCPPCTPPHCLPCPFQEPHCYNCLSTGCRGDLVQIPRQASCYLL